MTRQALLVLDMLSEFRFPKWQPVLRAALRIAPRIATLTARARKAGVPVIYVNDTAGKWESDQGAFVERCADERARGAALTVQVLPQEADFFIFKPKHSGFYATPLAELLHSGHVEELILCGSTAHQCVLFTAMDAFVRDLRLVVPRDCLAAPTPEQTRHALFILKHALQARVAPSRSVRMGRRIRLGHT